MSVTDALKRFNLENNFYDALKDLFDSLFIPLNAISKSPVNIRDILLRNYKENSYSFKLIELCHFLGLIDSSALNENKDKDLEDLKGIKADYEGIIIFGIKLKNRENGLLPTRSQLAEITRAFNREFYYTPVVLVFHYDDYLSIANTERLAYKQEWREGEKAGKISLLRDINLNNPHTGHIKILEDMKVNKEINSFTKLYEHWQKVFNISTLNNNFYKELSNWYFWAMDIVHYPSNEPIKDLTEHKAKNLIRLLTRLLFVWFVKEKKLIPEELFIKDKVSQFLDLNNESAYYKAVLQNLFFAVLNTEMGKREFRKEMQHQGCYNLMRYERFFTNTTEFLNLIQDIPFMNGGLFECLDHPDPEKKGSHGGDKTIFTDGFSDLKTNDISLPDYIFWGGAEHINLNEIYGNKLYSDVKVKGLLDILNSYKFTIEENTPVEEDIALDPELLGRVFENLLASYNPETKSTARKQTGSFYTPREIVNYMVDESLIAYFKNYLDDSEETDNKLRKLLSYNYETQTFEDDTKIDTIIKALDSCKILDPACGSGAFPMGILQKMVYILSKIDPYNEKWKNTQIKKAETIDDCNAGEKAIKEIEDAFINNELDYGRKLYLIEYCIFGVDIQPIAIQISKLRFFISLIVDQKINKDKENLGIRPLPNLEAKFVAANTLIGLEKPNQITLSDIETQPIEEEITKIRHRIFSCRTPQTKRNLREKEKEKRNELAQCLINYNFDSHIAGKIANWDPYDQNNFADFFEPEYMFGLKDGFDIVIGNPPYGAQSDKKFKDYCKKHYISAKTIPNVQKGSLDTFSLFIEKSFNSLKKNGSFINIVPISITSSDSMTGIQRLIENNCNTIKISSFSVRPQPIFQNAVVNTSIIFFKKTESSCNEIFTTKMYRKNQSLNLDKLMDNLEFIESKDLKIRGRYPKISYSIEKQILKKIFNQSTSLCDILSDNGSPIFYRSSGGRYFKVITPYSTGSTKEKSIFVIQTISNVVGALLSSNLYFWYYQIFSNNLDLKSFEIESFTIPLEKLDNKIIKDIENIYLLYLKDIELNANVRTTTNYANITSFKEYKIGKSKHLIDQIDDIICPLYGLNSEEIHFIKNYEIEFRVQDD